MNTNQQQPSQPSSSLYLMTFKDGTTFVQGSSGIPEDGLNKIIIDEQRNSFLKLKCFEIIPDVNNQLPELDQLVFDLTTNTEILKNLVSAAYKIPDKKEDYITLLNSISHFLSENIESKVKEVVTKLNYAIEFEEALSDEEK